MKADQHPTLLLNRRIYEIILPLFYKSVRVSLDDCTCHVSRIYAMIGGAYSRANPGLQFIRSIVFELTRPLHPTVFQEVVDIATAFIDAIPKAQLRVFK